MDIKTSSILNAKKAAGFAAVSFITEGMCVGIGTGSTVKFFIEALAKRHEEGLNITAVATSHASETLAQQLNIPLKSPESVKMIDLTVDGADEIDSHKNMIKGGGGALLREKLAAKSSREMIVIVDETKVKTNLGLFPVAVEIVPYLCLHTIHELETRGYHGKLRLNNKQKPYLTDNNNYIYDISYSKPIFDPEKEHQNLKMITGVVETGLFYQLAGRVIVGYEDGTVKIFENLKSQ